MQESAAALLDVVEGLLGGGDPLGMFAAFCLLKFLEGGGEELLAVQAEDVVGQELVQSFEEFFLGDPQAVGVPGGSGLVVFWGAGVERLASGLAEHPAAAGGAEHVGAQHVGAFGLRVAVASRLGAGPFSVAADLLGGDEGVQVDDRFVDEPGGPHPGLDRVRAAGAGLHSAPVPHHVAGVLGLDEDVADAAGGPVSGARARSGGLGGGLRRRSVLSRSAMTW